MKERYYYNLLTNDEKRIYDAFYAGVRRLMPEISIPNHSYSLFSSNRVYHALLADNPDFFYLSPQNCKTRTSTKEYVIIPEYMYSRNQINDISSKISLKASEIISKVCSVAGRDEEKKEKELHRYFQRNYIYDMQSFGSTNPDIVRQAYTMVGPLLYGKAVCDGFSKAYMYLLNAMDIRCIYVPGIARKDGHGSQNHSWNIVWHHGKTYHSDVTWDIPLKYDGMDSFDYLDLSDDSIYLDHSEFRDVPKCRHKDLEYYGNYSVIVKSPKEIEDLIRKTMIQRKKYLDFKLDSRRMPVGRVSYKNMITDTIKKVFNEVGRGGMTYYISERIETGVVKVKIEYT